MSTPSVFPMFMRASAGGASAQTLVQGLEVTVVDAVPAVTLVQEIEVTLLSEGLEVAL